MASAARGSEEGGTGSRAPLPYFGISASTLAVSLAVCSCILYTLNGELLQAVQLNTPTGEIHPSPMLNMMLCHLGGLVFVPTLACDGSRAYGPPKANASSGLLSGRVKSRIVHTLSSMPRLTALLFALVLMGYNYLWLLSSRHVAASVTNAIFQSSVAFVYVGSVVLFGEPVTLPRVLGVVLALAGTTITSNVFGLQGYSHTASSTLVGAGLALLAAVGLACYQVLFRLIFGHHRREVRFLGFFYGWISLWHIFVVLPLVLLASVLGIEALKLPYGSYAVVGTILTAAFASTVNVMNLGIVMWGWPMLLPCAAILSIPLQAVLDLVFHGLMPSLLQLVGLALIMGAVALISDLVSPQMWGTKSLPKGEGPEDVVTDA